MSVAAKQLGIHSKSLSKQALNLACQCAERWADTAPDDPRLRMNAFRCLMELLPLSAGAQTEVLPGGDGEPGSSSNAGRVARRRVGRNAPSFAEYVSEQMEAVHGGQLAEWPASRLDALAAEVLPGYSPAATDWLKPVLAFDALRCVQARAIEQTILDDRLLFLQEHSDVLAWTSCQALFDPHVSPRHKVFVAVRREATDST
eukprot:TRINITY_DN7623_c0_g1_i2.p1 TRINITY_DN7623_c0_g1~~TRINITY_DN7623_c0_g1_i2.p1  ORF type:complete len:209 (-),score=30.69 TRINITY_DN7623_c0_g1_i2:2-607(-)